MMKKLLLVLLFLPLYIFPQYPELRDDSRPLFITSESSWKEYLNKYIGSLDPIEGIWSVHLTHNFIASNGDIKTKETEETVGIFFNNQNEYFGGPGFHNINFGDESENFVFYKTASSSVYSYSRKGARGHAVLNGNVILQYSYQVPNKERDKKYIANYPKYIIDYTYTKMYPDLNASLPSSSSGTGFALNSEGFIVTNYHVVGDSKKITVIGVNGDFNTKHDANVIITDKKNDLAIIKVSTNLGNIPYKIKSQNSDVATEVYALGFPLRASMGDELKFTKGDISAKSGFQGDITSYQHTIAVQPGNSGGPMFDVDGYLVGVINAKHIGAENVSYSIKSKYLLNLIDEASSKISHSTTNLMYKKNIKDQVKQIRNFIYIIEVK
jgi:S1-C subfamily serine protease